ncbi:MAG TPA: hypothetical protein VFT22_39695, partial [Kofleriaceae bacterium]|nr:hypothetical protein [Kofleriaceae bacterium]
MLDASDLGPFFDNIHVLEFASANDRDTVTSTLWLAIDGEISVGFPGVQSARFVVGAPDITFVTATLVRTAAAFSITLQSFRFALRFGSDAVGGNGSPSELIFEGTIEIGSDLSITAIDGVITGDLGGVLAPGDEIRFAGFHLSKSCFALRWREPNVGRWLSKLSVDFVDQGPVVESDLTLRVVFGHPIQEIRLDCAITGLERTFKLPGFTVSTPDNVQFSLVFGGAGRRLAQLMFGVSFVPQTSLTAASDFAWERDGQREIHGDERRTEPLVQLKLTAQAATSLAVFDLELDQARIPRLFRQLDVPLAPLDFTKPQGLCVPTPLDTHSLTASSWSVELKLNLEQVPFDLPFLKQSVGADSQFLRITPDLRAISIDLPGHSVTVPVTITVLLGALELETRCELALDWEVFAFRILHDDGLKLFADVATIDPGPEHLGLRWRFKGALVPGGTPRYHLFTLATKDSKYALLQAPGAVFEVEYTQLSSEGVGFAITDFAVSPKGISLTADVLDRPVKLNGIDTQFRFTDTRLVIVENQITDFTLKGSGPLPPALVGDATVDIALQLAQRDGKLTLVSGGAQLKGSKLLDCKATRFQFSINAIGLKFVYEGKFHLYFTLTGSAQFKLASGDDREGALALLPNIKIDLVECPLTGDASVLSKHITFLIELPKPISFSFLAAFEMELRGIGFVPQADVFDGDGAMLISGQLKFAQGDGDAADSRVDLHKLYIGLPKPGSIIPRLHFTELPVHLNFGSVFRLNGSVDFVDGALEKGFTGEGSLEIEGLPTFATAFAFLRVRRDEASPWVRAWFVYAEVRKISLQIPVVEIFVREVGLGFGYRYTLASIRAADQANDVSKLLKELTVLSRTQGDLSRRDRWAVDLEDAGQDPRWTVAFRALVSQTSASASPLQYDEGAEKSLPSLFLLDAVVALRSDLTFLMSARGWLFANYYDYVTNYKGIRDKPVVSGFVLLSPRKKRFLAHVASNPGGQFGAHPPMPDLIQRALTSSQFSATLLIEPGLLHTELG